MMKVLSTKKLKPSLVKKAKEHHIEIEEKEMITIQRVITDEEVLKLAGNIEESRTPFVFTSGQAVKFLGDALQSAGWKKFFNQPVFCISGNTKTEVLSARFLTGPVTGEAGNAAGLADIIRSAGVKEVIFFCSRIRRDELPALLKAAGIAVQEVVVYDTLETPVAMNTDYDAVVFFSPSAVNSFFSANHLKPETVCFTIGNTTSKVLSGFTKNRILTSPSPTQDEMIDLLIQYFTRPERPEKTDT
jgi:uroporphyrinogen-III synthase